jgi:predicted porin
MQKKIIALAVAGLVSGAAFAQSNVTIYGTIDLAFTNKSDNTDSTKGTRRAIDDGGWDQTRLGWKGTEDLGNGLAVSFEQQFRTKADRRNAGFTQNKQILSLDSKTWGSVRAGTFGSVHDDINGYSEVGGMSYGNSVLDVIVSGDTYNALQYVSPSFSGFSFKAGLSTNDINADDADDNADGNVRAYAGLVQYVNGPLKVAASYDRKKIDSDTQKEWLISGGYDFGVVKLGLGYDKTTYKNGGATITAIDGSDLDTIGDDFIGADQTRKAWRLNVGAPIGATNAVALSYSRVKLDRAAGLTDLKARGIGLSFHHMMSKRTNVYAAYGDVGQSDSTAFYSGYEKLFKVGVRHQF